MWIGITSANFRPLCIRLYYIGKLKSLPEKAAVRPGSGFDIARFIQSAFITFGELSLRFS